LKKFKKAFHAHSSLITHSEPTLKRVKLISFIMGGTTMRLFEGTEFDRPPRCEKCEQLEVDCACVTVPAPPAPPVDQTAIISLEKRKKGKLVTVVNGLFDGHPGNHFKNLLVQLKNQCGAGGSIQEQKIEIQGDHQERLRSLLKAKGFKIKP
jgi:translation initiation factor 1